MTKLGTVIRKIIEECLLLSFFTAVLSPFCLSNSYATIFWDDELESGKTGYFLPNNGAMSFDTSIKFSGTGSLRYNFGSECYPDASAQAHCGGFTDRSFTQTTNLYKRFYFRMSAGFQVSDVFTKIMRSDGVNGSIAPSDWWVMGSSGSKRFLVGAQGVPPSDTTNYFTSFTFNDGQWFCVETHEQLNTPGVANGILEAWIDGTKVMSVTNVKFLQSGQTNTFYNNRLYRQTGRGSIWLDRLAVGDQRIGCVGSGSSTTGTVPPATPTGLTVE